MPRKRKPPKPTFSALPIDTRREALRALVDQALFVKDAAQGVAGTRSKQRDHDAHQALKIADIIFDSLAGWARDHVVGRNARMLPPVRYAPGVDRERSLGEERPWDDPALERLGANYEFTDPEVFKRTLREFAEILPGVFGKNFHSATYNAFDTLLFGQESKLLLPSPRNLKGDAKALWELRLAAIQHVEFRRGCGMKKYKAQDVVADAYGINTAKAAGIANLEGWEDRLPRYFDKHMVEDSIESARNVGTWYRKYKEDGPSDAIEQDHLDELERWFGEERLRKDGARFKQLNPRNRRPRKG